MIDPDADPTLIAGQVVHPVRNRLAEFLILEVMDVDFLRFPLRLPFLSRVLEFPTNSFFFVSTDTTRCCLL